MTQSVCRCTDNNQLETVLQVWQQPLTTRTFHQSLPTTDAMIRCTCITTMLLVFLLESVMQCVRHVRHSANGAETLRVCLLSWCLMLIQVNTQLNCCPSSCKDTQGNARFCKNTNTILYTALPQTMSFRAMKHEWTNRAPSEPLCKGPLVINVRYRVSFISLVAC